MGTRKSHKKAHKLCAWMLLVLLLLVAGDVSAQRKTKKKHAPKQEPPSELTKLREEFVKATNDYKASLEKLLAIYEENVKKAEDKVTVSKKLLAEGLIAKTQVEDAEHTLALEKQKVEETRRQMTSADAQIAGVLVETAADEEIAKNLRFAKQTLIRTSAFTRYTGSSGWNLTDAWKIQ